MTEGNKLFIVFFSTILFCIGVFLMLHYAAIYKELITVTREKYRDKHLYSQIYSAEGDRISYAELISTLCGKLEYDIEIEGVFLDKDQFSPEDINSYHIEDAPYKKSYVYSDSGNIDKINYTVIKE